MEEQEDEDFEEYLSKFEAQDWNNAVSDQELVRILNEYFSINSCPPLMLQRAYKPMILLYVGLSDLSKLDFALCFPYIRFDDPSSTRNALAGVAKILFCRTDLFIKSFIKSYRIKIYKSKELEETINWRMRHLDWILRTNRLIDPMPDDYLHAMTRIQNSFRRMMSMIRSEKEEEVAVGRILSGDFSDHSISTEKFVEYRTQPVDPFASTSEMFGLMNSPLELRACCSHTNFPEDDMTQPDDPCYSLSASMLRVADELTRKEAQIQKKKEALLKKENDKKAMDRIHEIIKREKRNHQAEVYQKMFPHSLLRPNMDVLQMRRTDMGEKLTNAVHTAKPGGGFEVLRNRNGRPINNGPQATDSQKHPPRIPLSRQIPRKPPSEQKIQEKIDRIIQKHNVNVEQQMEQKNIEQTSLMSSFVETKCGTKTTLIPMKTPKFGQTNSAIQDTSKYREVVPLRRQPLSTPVSEREDGGIRESEFIDFSVAHQQNLDINNYVRTVRNGKVVLVKKSIFNQPYNANRPRMDRNKTGKASPKRIYRLCKGGSYQVGKDGRPISLCPIVDRDGKQLYRVVSGAHRPPVNIRKIGNPIESAALLPEGRTVYKSCTITVRNPVKLQASRLEVSQPSGSNADVVHENIQNEQMEQSTEQYYEDQQFDLNQVDNQFDQIPEEEIIMNDQMHQQDPIQQVAHYEEVMEDTPVVNDFQEFTEQPTQEIFEENTNYVEPPEQIENKQFLKPRSIRYINGSIEHELINDNGNGTVHYEEIEDNGEIEFEETAQNDWYYPAEEIDREVEMSKMGMMPVEKQIQNNVGDEPNPYKITDAELKVLHDAYPKLFGPLTDILTVDLQYMMAAFIFKRLENPDPSQGYVYIIKVSEETEILIVDDEETEQITELHFEMNFNTMCWRRFLKTQWFHNGEVSTTIENLDPHIQQEVPYL